MFDTNPKVLGDVLKQAAEGKLQLPDFQRSYVWADEDVRSLLASVIRGFPVGALLTLEAGSEVNFKPRLIEGVTAPGAAPEQLLLDGQQRITSLFGVLYAQTPMKTRLRRKQRKQVNRFYYIDITQVTADPLNIEDAIIGVGANRAFRDVAAQKTYELSTPKREYEANAFPLNIIFDSGAVRKWLKEWSRYWDDKGVCVAAMEDGFDDHVRAPLQKYKMPVIKLDKSSTREAMCLIFEKVNGGAEPERLSRFGFTDVRLASLRSRNAAACLAVNALLSRAGCRDFATGNAADLATFYNEPLDIHHIFPRDWCELQGGISEMRMNSIFNKAPISAEANRSIGCAAPSVYLARLEAKGTLGAELDAILTSHLITPETLLSGDFDLFYIQRKEPLCKLIEDAIGKPVARSLPDDEDAEMLDDQLEAAE